MARFINQQEIIENNIAKHVEIISSSYTRYLESKPNFVTYFSRNELASIYDKGLENVEKDIGQYSPNKYNKIENFPVYGLEELLNNISLQDSGLDTEVTSKIIILPGTIKPLPSDFFIINYMNKEMMFKVTNVTSSHFKSKPIYEVEFFFERNIYSEKEFEDNIEKEYSFLFENIGSNEKPIIEKKDYLLIVYTEKLIDGIIEMIDKYFYDNKLNCILTEVNNTLVYNKYLTHFLIKNNILSRKLEFMNTIHLVDIFDYKNDPCFFVKYNKSIYGILEKQDPENLEYINFKIKKFDHKLDFSQFDINNLEKNHIEFIKFKNINSSKEENEYFDKEFFNRIINNMEYEKKIKINVIKDMIIKYIHDEFKLDERYLNSINNMDFEPNFTSYFYLPIIVFILKKSIKNITEKYDQRYFVLQ